MNVISISKFYTAVCFLLVTLLGPVGYANQKTTYEMCDKRERASQANRDECSTKHPSNSSAYDTCLNQIAEKKCAPYQTQAEITAQDEQCKEAYEKFEKGRKDTANACESVLTSRESKNRRTDKQSLCEDRILACEKLAAETAVTAPESDNRLSKTIDLIRGVVASEEPDLFSEEELGPNQCLIDVDNEESEKLEKSIRDQRKELIAERKKLMDENIKADKTAKEDTIKLEKEIKELERDNKELLATVDKEMREQINTSQKDLVDATARIRKMTTEISKKNDLIRAKTFSFQEAMQEISSTKVEQKCKEVITIAKDCMIKSAKNSFKSQAEVDACKSFPTLKTKGIRATAELKRQLKTINETCYESAEKEKRKANFNQQEEIKKATDEITELQSQLKDEAERQKIQSENAQKIQQEAERKKQEAEANLIEQINTLRKEMTQVTESTIQSIKTNIQELERIEKELQELDMQAKTGKKSNTALAKKAVRSTKVALDEIKEFCGCTESLQPASGTTAIGKTKCNAAFRTIPLGIDQQVDSIKPSKTGK